MSIQRFRLALAALAVVAFAVVGASQISTLTAEHDGWDIVRPVSIPAEPLVLDPPDLLTRSDRTDISSIIREESRDIRRYGIPWSAVVVSDTTLAPGVDGDQRASELLVEMAIESEEGADDGMVMLVVVQEADHRESTVHFAAGENFYPMGGITEAQLRWIADVQMAPIIDENRIGPAVTEGAIWVEWMQLFEPPPDPARSTLQSGLARLLHPLGTLAFAGLALGIGALAMTVAVVTRRGTTDGDDAAIDLTSVHAAALAEGRVRPSLMRTVVDDAVERGLLERRGEHLALGTGWVGYGPYDHHIRDAHTRLENDGAAATVARLARALWASPLPREIENDLAGAGLFHPRSVQADGALRTLGIIGGVIGGAALVLAVIGETTPTLLAALLLAAVGVSVVIWNGSRRWTTGTGTGDDARHQSPGDLAPA